MIPMPPVTCSRLSWPSAWILSPLFRTMLTTSRGNPDQFPWPFSTVVRIFILIGTLSPFTSPYCGNFCLHLQHVMKPYIRICTCLFTLTINVWDVEVYSVTVYCISISVLFCSYTGMRSDCTASCFHIWHPLFVLNEWGEEAYLSHTFLLVLMVFFFAPSSEAWEGILIVSFTRYQPILGRRVTWKKATFGTTRRSCWSVSTNICHQELGLSGFEGPVLVVGQVRRY